jgi:tRNA U34 2-thiouridine synthase MnmA/TrmU
VVFDDPQSAIAPGQALVMYQGEEVVGGGWIEGNSELRTKNSEQRAKNT